MSRFGFPITGDLLQSGLGYSGQAASLNQSWTNAALQNSAQQAALAEARRRALEQEKLQRQAIKAQKEAQDKAQTNQWLSAGLTAGAGAAGGAVLGGLAAAPVAGGAAGGASAAPAAAATAGPVGATGVSAASAPALSQAAASQGAMFGSAPVSPGLGNNLVQPIGSAAIGPTQTFQPPQLQPFAGGSVGRGAGYGALLGGLGGLTGQNLLGPALAMPYQQYGAQLQGMNSVADWANQANNQALGWARYGEDVAHHRETTDIAREGNQIHRDQWNTPSANTLASIEGANLRHNTPSADASLREQGTQNRFMTIPPVAQFNADQALIRQGKAQDFTMGLEGTRQTNRKELQQGSQSFRSEQNRLGRDASMDRAKFTQAEITKRANQGGTAGRTPSVGYSDTAQRIMNAGSAQDAIKIVDYALEQKAITPGEAADLKRRLGM